MPRTTVLLGLPLVLLFTARAAADPPPSAASPAPLQGEIQRLLQELDHDQFEVRRAACARIEHLLAEPERSPVLSAELQRALVEPTLPFEVRWHVERWARRLSAISPESPAQVSPEEIDRLVGQLDHDCYALRVGAAERLKWFLSQDQHLSGVVQALQARQNAAISEPAKSQVQKLLDLTRPAMVAEFWQDGRQLGEQHLLIGVPSLGPGALRPSHFDRIDDQVAHCVSGSNLSPGDYPVGVAIPHPSLQGALFQLVNLPTPARRLAYARESRTDDGQRLAALSRRTLQQFLKQRRALSEAELLLLGQLDAKEVSRFANDYLPLVRDDPLPAREPGVWDTQRLGGRPSRLGMLAAQLAVSGTNEAIPGLLQAIEKQSFLAPTPTAPYQLSWLAALAIATRDPWAQCDAWLAGLVQRSDSLVENGRPDAPQLGATAAALLLRRHQQSPEEFGLRPVSDNVLARLGVQGSRFSSVDHTKQVQQWWNQVSQKEARPTAAPAGPNP